MTSPPEVVRAMAQQRSPAREITMTFRCGPAERDEIKQRAAALGLSVQDYTYMRLLDRPRPEARRSGPPRPRPQEALPLPPAP